MRKCWPTARAADARDKAAAEAKAKAAADAKAKAAETKAKEAKAAKAANPARQWVQVATGGDAKALAFDFRRLAKKYPALFKGHDGGTSEWGKTRRLVVGPFDDAPRRPRRGTPNSARRAATASSGRATKAARSKSFRASDRGPAA